jgi:transcriptional regulator with XRE-family HTH domain
MLNVLHRLQDRKSVSVLSVKNKFWTKTGLEKLGYIIQQSRESRGLSLRQAADIIGESLDSSCYIQTVDHGTLSRVEKSHGEPKFNTLVAIAASRIVTCDRGVPLSIYDFIAEDIIEFCGITINPAHDEQDCSMGH